MLLMNRMEDKQLNFEKPLLSVRRYSLGVTVENDGKRKVDKSPTSAPRPPRYQSELKSGPVRNPGTVPFSWEQNPGRPKDGIELKSCVVDNRPPTVPKLPPGRTSKVNQQNVESSVHTNNPARIRSFDDETKQSGSSNDEYVAAGRTSSGYEVGEEYVDARERLSRTDSFFINCSISGLSGFEDSDTVVSENSLIDPETKDLMMGRFLPAAMAMTSESPQHPHWRLPVVSQPPKKVLSDEKETRLRHETNFVTNYSRAHENDDGGSDAYFEKHEDVPNSNLPCLVSPLRGMSVRTFAPSSAFRKPLPLLSSSGSCSEADAQHYMLDMIEQRPSVSSETLKLQECKRKLKNNRVNLNNNDTIKGVSAYRQLEGGDIPADGYGISVDCNGSVQYSAVCRNPEEATYPNGNGLGFNKVIRQSFQELLAEENRLNELDAGSLVAEKKVYVVSEHTMDPPTFKSHDFGIEEQQGGKKHQLFTERQELLPDFHVKSSTYEGNHHLQTGMANKGSRTLKQDFMHPSAPPGPEKFEKDSMLPIPPPLPKTPSDSWLGRTLPSMSGKKASVHPYLMPGASPKHQALKPKSSNPKWEFIVKMTKVEDQHLRFSQERLMPIPEA